MSTLIISPIATAPDCRVSTLHINNLSDSPFCYVIEDPLRDTKIPDKTGIPRFMYELKKKTVVTPLTVKYQAKYPWFKWFYEIQKVHNFTDIYIHSGVNQNSSSGCLIVGKTLTTTEISTIGYKSSTAYQLSSSAIAMKELYQILDRDKDNKIILY